MKTPRLVTPHRFKMVIMMAVVGVCAPSARAALGGSDGVVIPYAGKLELDGALVTGTVDFQFGVAPNASDAAPVNCVFPLPDVPVTNGEFAVSIVIPAARESCVKGKDVHLEVRVARADETLVLLGKQRVTPVVAAATSGIGDFAVTGALTANTAAVTGALSAGTTTVGALSAGPTTVTGNLVVTGGVSVGLYSRFLPTSAEPVTSFTACGSGEVAISGGGACPGTTRVSRSEPLFNGWIFQCDGGDPGSVHILCARLTP